MPVRRGTDRNVYRQLSDTARVRAETCREAAEGGPLCADELCAVATAQKLSACDARAESAYAGPQVPQNHESCPVFSDYETLVADLDRRIGAVAGSKACGRDTDVCCHEPFGVMLVEAAYLHYVIGSTLDQESRRGIAERLKNTPEGYTCALSVFGVCLLAERKRSRCRLSGFADNDPAAEERLLLLSRNCFCLSPGICPKTARCCIRYHVCLSGAYVQDYFAEAQRVAGRK